MARYRVLGLALLVTVLLAVVALAAHGRPLSRGGGGAGKGPPAVFYDYAWTTIVIFFLLLLALGIAGLWILRGERGKPRPYRFTLVALAGYCLFAVAFAYLAKHHFHFRHLPGSGENGLPGSSPTHSRGQTGSSRLATQGHNNFQWPELFAVLGVLLALGLVLYVRRARDVLPARRRDAPQSLAAALDESLDDLRADPDLRRAIIAAYARMEAALAAAGLPRRPAEAPLEYLERTLLSLDTSAEAVRRLTGLFEWARFSHHEPEPSMRDDAVDALIAVRDELRASELIPA
ncbi:MAG: DUF4129 domain-containing protein [Actinobacteria bacterium]|nr:MAG: DUF4129 domain-containing protein [Actinomycetota bacterium]